MVGSSQPVRAIGVRVNYVAIRGGNWTNGSLAGVFMLNLNNERSNVNTNIGARPALEMRQTLKAHAALSQHLSQKDAHSSANAEKLNRQTVPVSDMFRPQFGSAAFNGGQ